MSASRRKPQSKTVTIKSPANGGVQVISRAVAILRVLARHRDGLSLGQIAKQVDLPRSTVQRIVHSLVAEDMVMLVGAEGGFQLGSEIQLLAAAGRNDVVDAARPVIRALSQETGETVDLAQLRDSAMIFIDQIVGSHRLRTAATVGELFPLVCSANGKAGLAMLDDATARRLAQAELGADAEIVDAFMQELVTVRSRGYAYDLDQHTTGISAVGAAFVDRDQRVYAVSIPVPTPRFEVHREILTAKLIDAVDRIRARLSADGHDQTR